LPASLKSNFVVPEGSISVMEQISELL